MIHELYKWMLCKFRIRNAFVYPLLIGLIVFPLLNDVIAQDINFTKLDTRTIAKKWVFENIPSTASIFIEGNNYRSSPSTVPLLLSPHLIKSTYGDHVDGEDREKFYKVLKQVLKTKKTYNLLFTSNEESIKYYLDNSIGDYFIIRSKTIESFNFDENRKNFPQFYKLIKKVHNGEFILIKKIISDFDQVGPEIYIYKKNYNS